MILAFMRLIPLVPVLTVEIFFTFDNGVEDSIFFFIFIFKPLWKLNILVGDNISKKSIKLFLSNTVLEDLFDEHES